MRFSVIIPTYNRSGPMAAAVASVLAQSRPADEIIVINDGSSDDTAQVMAGFGDRIIAITKQNAGVSAARNTGIARATGDWLTFLDDDDLWLPDRLAVLERDIAACREPVAAHLANLRITGDGYDWTMFAIKGITCPDGSASIERHPFRHVINGLQINAFACTAGLAQEAGPFDTALSAGEDILFFARAALRGPWMFTNDVVAEVRRIEAMGASLTYNSSREPLGRFKGKLYVCERIAEEPMSAADRIALRDRQSFVTLDLARAQSEAGLGGDARANLISAARLHPSPLKGWVKSLLPLMLGRRGFNIVFSRVKRYVRN